MTPQELRKRLRWWKRELNLKAWTIRLRLVPIEKLPDCHGDVEFRADHDVATIRLRQDSPYIEFWLVHEIAHIVLAGLRPAEEGFNLIEEIAVNRITRALCRAHKIPCPLSDAL
jgi:hypothetical protein